MSREQLLQLKNIHNAFLFEYIPHEWEGDAIDILNLTESPAGCRLNIILKNEFLSDMQLRLFAVWCTRQAFQIPWRIESQVSRVGVKISEDLEICSNTCNVVERFANGYASTDELDDARDAALKVSREALSVLQRMEGSIFRPRHRSNSLHNLGFAAACCAVKYNIYLGAYDAAIYASQVAALNTNIIYFSHEREAARNEQLEHLKTFFISNLNEL